MQMVKIEIPDRAERARALVERPPVERDAIRLNVNLDMISRNAENELYAAGTSHYPYLKPWIEAAATQTWYRYVGPRGAIIGMTTFGASGVGKDLFKHFGFTADNVVRAVSKLLQ